MQTAIAAFLWCTFESLSCRTGSLRSATPQTKTCLRGPRLRRSLRDVCTVGELLQGKHFVKAQFIALLQVPLILRAVSMAAH
jgi:hypothetical protein